MHRIAGALSKAGYNVLLIGRKHTNSYNLLRQTFDQKRLFCFFSKGPLFYAEYNIRLFLTLLFLRADIVCAIDLDTILPVYFATAIKHQKRVYDAHELFTEMKEIVTRPATQKIWLAIERFAVPKFRPGYTVNDFIAGELTKRYGVQYAVIRNLPYRKFAATAEPGRERFLLCQGAVNEGRSFETLIPAMKEVDARLVIIGTGNFFSQAKQLISLHALQHKIELRGDMIPDDLRLFTPKAYIGITLFEETGLNQYYSLANRFFDYIMAGIPQLCVNFPEYAAINKRWPAAYLLNATDAATIAGALNNLLADDVLYQNLRIHCLEARETLNWENEEQELLSFYKAL